MQIILARHGNTFNPGETAVWVGSRNDLPLTASGLKQAEVLAQSMQHAQLSPAAIYCGPLQRTRVYGQLLSHTLQLKQSPTIEARLNEIDYGDWTGLSNADICERYGSEELDAWEHRSQWPQTANWSGNQQTILSEVRAFSAALVQQHQPDDTIVIVSSNGRLRYFLTLIEGEFERHIAQRTFKVATGNICQLSFKQGSWHLDYWNKTPPQGLNQPL